MATRKSWTPTSRATSEAIREHRSRISLRPIQATSGPARVRLSSNLPLDHRALDRRDGLGGIEVLGAGVGAIHDGVAAVEPERVLEIVAPLARALVAAV